MGINTYAKTVQGTSHIRAKKMCEDYSWYDKHKKTCNWTLCVVADGHGSDRCKYSHDGSRLAVAAFCKVVRDAMVNDSEILNHMKINERLSQEFVVNVKREWKKRVIELHLANQRETDNSSMKRTSVKLAHVKAEDMNFSNKEIDYLLYGTTLIGVVQDNDNTMIFQIGDGDAVYVDRKGAVHLTESDNLLGVETHSLAEEDYTDYTKLKILNFGKTGKNTFMIILATDGLSNSYTDDNAFLDTCSEYYYFAKNKGFKRLCDGLGDNRVGWLREISDGGSGDDVSIAMLYYKPDIKDYLRLFARKYLNA